MLRAINGLSQIGVLVNTQYIENKTKQNKKQQNKTIQPTKRTKPQKNKVVVKFCC